MFKRKSVIFKWFLSYSLVLVVPLLIGIFTYVEVENTLENQIIKSNETLLEQLQSDVDAKLSNIKAVYTQVAFQSDVQKLLATNETNASTLRLYAYNASKNLKPILVSNEAVKDICIYFHEIDMAITQGGIMDGISLANRYGRYPDFEAWHQYFTKDFTDKYILLKREMGWGESYESISYVCSLPVDKKPAQATVIVTLAEDKVLNDMNQVKKINGGDVMLLDNHGEVICTTNRELMNFFSAKDFQSYRGLSNKEMQGETGVVSHITSLVNGYKYVISTAKEVYWSPLRYVKNLIVIFVFLSLFTGTLINVFLIGKHYRPIQHMVEQIEKIQTDDYHNGVSEYDFIYQGIIDTIEKSDKISLKLEKQRVDAFFTRLLKGKVRDVSNMEGEWNTLHLPFTTDTFVTVLFHVEDFTALFANEKDITDDERYDLTIVVIKNIFEELIGSLHPCYVMELDNFMVGIVSVSRQRKQDINHDISVALQEGMDFIDKNFELSLNAAVSSPHNTYFGLTQCYLEAYETMEYMRVLGQEGITFYESIQKEGSYAYYYPIEKETQLTNCMLVGDSKGAKEVVDEILDRNFGDLKPNTDLIKCLMVDLISTIIKTSTHVGFKQEENDQWFSRLNMLLHCETIHEMKDSLESSIDLFCTYMNQQLKGNVRDIKGLVMEYVNKNFDKQDLDVAKVSDHLGLTPSYATKLFKEETGEMLSGYINRVRVEKAKALIATYRYTFIQIARMVGYLDSRALGRAFKRLEGISLSEYKELLIKNKPVNEQ